MADGCSCLRWVKMLPLKVFCNSMEATRFDRNLCLSGCGQGSVYCAECIVCIPADACQHSNNDNCNQEEQQSVLYQSLPFFTLDGDNTVRKEFS